MTGEVAVALGLQNLALFALTVAVVNATPGVDLLFTVTRTLQHGVRGGLAAAAGIGLGCVVHAMAAAFGLAALLATSAAAFDLLKLAGAAYLLWFGAGMLRRALRPAPAVEPPVGTAAAQMLPTNDARSTVPLPAILRQGLLTNLLNPKVAIFFLALLPQFISADAAHKTLAFLTLGGWFVLQGMLFLGVIVLLAAPLRRWRPAPRGRRVFDGLAGALFVGLAARLALAERP
ncbi:MAG: LysE family translocator [Burkholderiaceae bacterium]